MARRAVERLNSNDLGTSAVEFAMIAPVLLLMIWGMIAYGIYFSAAHSLQQMAANAARHTVAGLDEDERKDLAQLFIDQNFPESGMFQRDHLEIGVFDTPDVDNQFEVVLTYDASALPIWDVFAPLPLPSKTIKRHSVIRVGGH